MTGNERPTREGWAWPLNARKAHYMTEDNQSLCQRWWYSGPRDDSDPFAPGPDDCAGCRRRFTAAYGNRSPDPGEQQ